MRTAAGGLIIVSEGFAALTTQDPACRGTLLLFMTPECSAAHPRLGLLQLGQALESMSAAIRNEPTQHSVE